MLSVFSKFKSLLIFYVVIIFLIFSFNSCSNNPVTNSTVVGKITILIDSTLDEQESNIVITTINKAVIYKFSAPNTIIKTATISGGKAIFDLTNFSSGDYFFVFNDSILHRSPTYIVDNTKNYDIKVGQKVRESVILSSTGDSLFKFKTHAQADGENEVLKYSNDQGTGRYAYAFINITSRTLDIRYLDDGSVINSMTQSGRSYHYDRFGSWDLGLTNHGKAPGGDSLATRMMCGSTNCHNEFWVKPPQWTNISRSYGWCNRCHNGYAGACSNFYDKNQ